MAFTLPEAEKCYQTAYLPLNWVPPQKFSGNDRSELNRRIDQNHTSRAYCFAAFPAKIKQYEATEVRGADDYFRQIPYLKAQSKDDQESFLHGIDDQIVGFDHRDLWKTAMIPGAIIAGAIAVYGVLCGVVLHGGFASNFFPILGWGLLAGAVVTLGIAGYLFWEHYHHSLHVPSIPKLVDISIHFPWS